VTPCAVSTCPPSRRAEHYMGMPQATRFWTPDEARALPEDGHRYEVVAGELLVTPAPTLPHQRAVGRLLRLLEDYLDETPVGYATFSPADLPRFFADVLGD
jgi:Uma2 family endonuclease